MSDPHVQKLIAEVLSHDDDVRKAAEAQIEGLRQNNVDMLCMSLIHYARKSNDLATRQSALLILKTVIVRSWSVGFDQFVGPIAINESIKAQIKEHLLQLLTVPENKIRNACAAMLARIASVDFPDQWPDLGGLLLQLITPKPDDHQLTLLDGGLMLLRDMLDDTITEQEFFKLGNDIINALFNIAADSLIGAPHRALAVQCFTRCIEFFFMADDNGQQSLDKFAQTVIPKWTDNVIIPILHETSADKNTIALKMGTCNLIREIESHFKWFQASLLNQLLPVLWKDLKTSVPHYVSNSVNNSTEQIQDIENTHSMVTGNSDCSISDWVTATVDAIVGALGCEDSSYVRSVIDTFTNDKEILDTVTNLALITMQDIFDWQNDFNIFVAEQMELALEPRVRPELSPILTESRVSLDAVVDNVIQLANNGMEWTWIEAALYLLGSYLLDDDDDIVTPQMIQKMLPIISNGMMDTADCLFQSRCLIVGALLHRYAAEPDLTSAQHFVDNLLNIGLNTDNATVKAASLLAFDQIPVSAFTSSLNYQERLFRLISYVAEDAEDETPSMLVDLLMKLVELDPQQAVRESAVVNMLLVLVAKDTSKIALTIDVTETFELLAAKATEFGCYDVLMSNALIQPLNVIRSAEATTWEYSTDTVLAFDIISALLSKGPKQLNEEIVSAVLPLLYQSIMRSNDDSILQSASEAFTPLILNGADKITEYQENENNGPQMILQVASRLLDPTRENESGVVNAGKIVQAILTSFGHFFTPDLLRDIIIASAFRLTVSDDIILSENLVMVFCQLVIDSPGQVVDMLYNIDQGATLKGVMSKWLQTFEVVRGLTYIRQNVSALQVLFELNDTRISSMSILQPILPTDGTIITRSKANNLKYAEMPVPTKIIKLLTSELTFTPRESKLAKAASKTNEEPDDDDWEDVLDLADDTNTSDIGTQNIIAEWFKRISNTPEFLNIYNSLSETEKRTVRECARF